MPIIQIRRGSEIEWSVSSRILEEGELALNTTNNKLKVGNGSQTFGQLPYINVLPSELTTLAETAIAAFIDGGTGIDFNTTTGELSIDNTVATKLYVDTAISALEDTVDTGYIPISARGTIDGVAPLDENVLVPEEYIPTTIARESDITDHNNDTSNVHGITDTSLLLTTAGGTLTGFLTLHSDPTNTLHAATMEF